MAKASDLALLRGSLLFQGLSEEELRSVFENTQPESEHFYKGDIVISQWTRDKRIGLLRKGTLISTNNDSDGEAQVLAIYKPKDVIGLELAFSREKLSSLEFSCQSNCEIVFIPFSILFAPGLTGGAKEKILFNIAVILSDEQVKLISQMEILSKKTLEKRIMTYLNIMSEKKGTNSFDIHMNQSQLAQYLCVNRSVLSYELNRLRGEGLIDYDKSRYTILGQSKL
ncbi:Crp/Fnr family transcriptional regulator [Bacillota bacterium]